MDCAQMMPDVAQITDKEIAHSNFRRKLAKWRLRLQEHSGGVAVAR